MVKKLLSKSLLLATMLIVGAGSVLADEVAYKTLTFPDDDMENNKVGSYEKTWTATIGEDSWTINNFNNNNWFNWTYIKCGRKNYASVATIVNDAAYEEAITKVVVTVDAVTASKINSSKLYVSSNSDFSNSQTIKATISTGDVTFTIPTPTEKCYYKLEFDCASGSSNGLITISKITYYYEETTGLTKIATIGDDFATTSLDLNAEGNFTRPTITFAEGTTEGVDYEVEWSSSDENLLNVATNGSYRAGSTGGSVDVTITVEPYDDTVYEAVSKTFTVNVVDPNRKGTEANPYTVAEVIDGTATGNDVYVKGFIVGSFNNGSVTSTYAESNLALADTYDESGSNAIPVQLVNGTAPRTNFNPQNNPWNVNVAQVLVKANVETYFSVNGLKSTSEIQKVAEQVNITSAGMATYYTDCALDFTEFTDMYAYTATVSGSTITFSRVMQVPANTGVLLRNPAEAAASNVVPVATGTVDAVQGNKFVGTLTDITVSDAGCYILNNGSEGLGFYKVKSSGSKVAAHRAYLKTGDGVRSFIGFSEGEANGIESVGAEAGLSMEVYNLQGVRVAQPTKGLYIMNGKKVIFK